MCVNKYVSKLVCELVSERAEEKVWVCDRMNDKTWWVVG